MKVSVRLATVTQDAPVLASIALQDGAHDDRICLRPEHASNEWRARKARGQIGLAGLPDRHPAGPLSMKTRVQRASGHSHSRGRLAGSENRDETMDQKLQQAVRTLRAIRQRYEAGRNADFGFVRSYSVQVALGYADMRWITAAIEVLEKAIAPSSSDDLERVQRTSVYSSHRTTIAAISHSAHPPPVA
jgi:hypothetical protein